MLGRVRKKQIKIDAVRHDIAYKLKSKASLQIGPSFSERQFRGSALVMECEFSSYLGNCDKG